MDVSDDGSGDDKMRLFLSFVSIAFLIAAGILIQKIGGNYATLAFVLFVFAIHIEIGLRVDEMELRIMKVIRLVDQYYSGRIS